MDTLELLKWHQLLEIFQLKRLHLYRRHLEDFELVDWLILLTFWSWRYGSAIFWLKSLTGNLLNQDRTDILKTKRGKPSSKGPGFLVLFTNLKNLIKKPSDVIQPCTNGRLEDFELQRLGWKARTMPGGLGVVQEEAFQDPVC